MSLEKEMVLGVDLGTTFSAVAKWDGRGPVPIEGRDGRLPTPSVVYYNPSGTEPTVGRTAVQQTLRDPENGVVGVKRLMDEGDKPIMVDGEPALIGGKERTPIEVSTAILKRVIGDVLDKVPSSTVGSSVVTVPYYFRAHQCEHTRRAAELAKANCRHILQEPIAASLDYAFLEREGSTMFRDETILVFDLGGGTFDLTLFNTHTTPNKVKFEVLATGGDDRLGGIDFENQLMKIVHEKAGIDLSGLSPKAERHAIQKIRAAVEDAKISLTTADIVDVILVEVPAKEAEIQITRAEFESCISGYIEKIDSILRKTLHAGNIDAAGLDRVIRVGGSSRIPAMKTMLDKLIGLDKVWSSREMDLTVCRGACLYAAFVDDPEVFGREIEFITRTSHALGVEIQGGRFHKLVRENRKTPCEARQSFHPESDGLTELEIKIYQGSGATVGECTHIGSVKVDGLRPKPRLDTQVDVKFRVGADQTLTVSVEVDGRRADNSFVFA